jgi:hypothetical protein
MKRLLGLALVTLLWGAAHVSAAPYVFDFEDGTDQGFGNGFGDDASKSWPIVSIGGSKRMELVLGGFQVAGRASQGSDAFLTAMNNATSSPAVSTISYDWYVDTGLSPGNYGNFLQIGTYINAGSGAYAQHEKEVELDGGQLASGSLFSGTVTQTLTAKYGALDPGFLSQTFQRLGIILNGDGAQTKVYIDNVTINTPAVPEPASLALAAIGIPALAFVARRRRK